jgi:hypothetical protein
MKDIVIPSPQNLSKSTAADQKAVKRLQARHRRLQKAAEQLAALSNALAMLMQMQASPKKGHWTDRILSSCSSQTGEFFRAAGYEVELNPDNAPYCLLTVHSPGDEKKRGDNHGKE